MLRYIIAESLLDHRVAVRGFALGYSVDSGGVHGLLCRLSAGFMLSPVQAAAWKLLAVVADMTISMLQHNPLSCCHRVRMKAWMSH
jgi:hypothetical protein